MRDASISTEGLTLRQAALTAGFAYLVNPVVFAESYAYPKLVVPGNMEQTVQNIAAHRELFAAAILCYLLSFILDVVVAWALYYLLAPVNRALSLLMAWFQTVYAAIALCAALNLATVFNILVTPDYLKVFGPQQTYAQVRVLFLAFRSGWDGSLVLFGIHLVLLGYLMVRSGYKPRILSKIIGVLLVIDGSGWIINSVGSYFFPNANLFGYLFITFCGEIFFMLWLLIRGWTIEEQASAS